MVIEGINTTKAAYNLQRLNIEMLIVEQAGEGFVSPYDPKEVVMSMTRKGKHEMEKVSFKNVEVKTWFSTFFVF